jgi:transglutaminase-like putative cysteine protease
LRIAVLTQFNGVEWTTGSRAIIGDQTANGLLTEPEQGLDSSVPSHSFNYQITATNDFDSTWLPTQFPVSSITAGGDWHYDLTTMDFLGLNGTDARGQTWRMVALKPKLSAYSMIRSLSAPLAIQAPYTALPSTVPPMVSQLAEHVTAGATSRFQRAVELQNWFRSSGGFRYSLKTHVLGNGTTALEQFLAKGHGGRVGYCEQFASAFAVMARELDMPARVAVGFLKPHKVSKDGYLYSAHDLHAWPEVYFRGSGWVRFEPTPATRTGTGGAPAYTTGKVQKPKLPSIGPSGGGKATDPTTTPSSKPRNQTTTETSTSSAVGVPWMDLVIALVVLALVVVLVLVPGSVRRSRRTRRLAAGAEDAWAELRDSALDLGVSWPSGRSPHETGERLAGWFGPDPDGPPSVRPPRGHGLAPAAEEALDRIVLVLEQVRYARSANDVAGGLAADVRSCIEALEHGSTTATLRRARWLPRTVFGSRSDPAQAALERQPEAVSPGGVVDHVG